MSSSVNNGGSTDYYKLNRKWKDGMDIIEARGMNYSQGNIFKVAMTFNLGRHSGTDYERELNKIVYFANRELERLKNDEKLKEAGKQCEPQGIPECSNPACIVTVDNPLGVCKCGEPTDND